MTTCLYFKKVAELIENGQSVRSLTESGMMPLMNRFHSLSKRLQATSNLNYLDLEHDYSFFSLRLPPLDH